MERQAIGVHNTPLARRRLSDIEAAIERAKAYAEALGVPLTVERLAAEMDMELELFRHILQEQETGKSPGMKAKIAAIQKAGGEATASVMEHAMRRGTSPNMHILYLKNHAGYDVEKGKNGREEPGPPEGPVVFLGEEEISD